MLLILKKKIKKKWTYEVGAHPPQKKNRYQTKQPKKQKILILFKYYVLSNSWQRKKIQYILIQYWLKTKNSMTTNNLSWGGCPPRMSTYLMKKKKKKR